jgi:hypothetical protein
MIQSQASLFHYCAALAWGVTPGEGRHVSLPSYIRRGRLSTCGTPIAADAVGESDPAAMLACPDDIDDPSGVVTRLLGNPNLAARIAGRGLDRARQEFDPLRMADRTSSSLRVLGT